MSDSFPYSLPIMDVIRHDYERFRFDTHKYTHKGLFTDGDLLFAVILEVNSNKELLEELSQQYHHFKTAGIPAAKIVGEILDSYKPIALRNSIEKSHLHGHPMNMHETINELNLHIPKKYHPFYVDFKYGTNKFQITLKCNFTESDKEEIQLICESLGYQGYDYVFIHNDRIKDYPGEVHYKPNQNGNLLLAASGLIHKQFPKELLACYEEDEDFWLENRHFIFSGNHSDSAASYLLPGFDKIGTRCFVDASVFSRLNIRVYLTLYEQVVIALPLEQSNEHFYEMFKINRFELRELIFRGRLLFVVPQNLARYSQSLLLDIISVNPNSIIFSRRLAAATIQGIQEKSGVVGTTFSSDEQYNFVHHCSRSGNLGLQRLADMLSAQWQFGEYIVNKEGAVGAHYLGLSEMAIMGFKEKGKDYTIELSSASSSYEFSQGLKAHHFPFDSSGYSEVNACQIISGLYNGVVSTSQTIRESEISTILSKVFAVNNDMSVLELDDALSRSLIRTLPKIIGEFSRLSEEQRTEKLYCLNKEIQRIEKNQTRVASLDFAGAFIPAAAGAVMEYSNVMGAGYISLGGWAIKALEMYTRNSDLINNPVYIKLSSLNHLVSQDAVIVKHVRDAFSTVNG
ncbi:hypothetical protein H4N55_06325 [Aeromonas veronii]|uniref:hypothetical protein n=1 Tax=Aeromonas TaxID=642 RepID=UPI00188BD662|nr:hypothetical protein [Aeromonas veronii]ELM3750735.1 hypothetical protein [Aeromonas dhakensis]MBF3236232.1 hypothetical protein [Aeromonas veronii]